MSLYLPEIRVFLNSLLNFCKVVTYETLSLEAHNSGLKE